MPDISMCGKPAGLPECNTCLRNVTNTKPSEWQSWAEPELEVKGKTTVCNSYWYGVKRNEPTGN